MSPDPKTVREIARDCAADYLGDACDIAAHAIGHFGPGAPDDLYPWITAVRADLAAAVATWPDEQQPADVVTAERQQDGAAEDVTAFLDAWEADRGFGNAIRGGNADMPYLFATDLRAVLAERTALAARVAELESEREADTRAVVAPLSAQADGASMAECKHAFTELRARFADRIEALDDDTDGGAE